jgi:hypothetical protein
VLALTVISPLPLYIGGTVISLKKIYPGIMLQARGIVLISLKKIYLGIVLKTTGIVLKTRLKIV